MSSDRDERSRRLLRSVVLASGVVASVAGLDTTLRGMRSFAGVRETGSPAAESESRFYGGIYLGLGLTTIALARRADRDPVAVQPLAGTIFLAGLARANAWRAVGAPHPVQRLLLAVELGGPPALVAWRAWLRARTPGAPAST